MTVQIKKREPLLERTPRRGFLTKRGLSEAIAICLEREVYFIKAAHAELQRFLDRYGSPPGFLLTPKKMIAFEEAMSRATQAGDARLLEDLGKEYLERVIAYVELARGRYWKAMDEEEVRQHVELGEPVPECLRPVQERLFPGVEEKSPPRGSQSSGAAPQDGSLEARFREWIGDNPHVLEKFIQVSLRFKREGQKKLGRQLIIEQMRWEWRETTVGSEFKLSNSYTSRLVRLAIETCPELDGYFELRDLHS